MATIMRTVVESPLYTAQLAAIEPDVRRTDIVHESFSYEVASGAESFPTIIGTPLRFLRTRANLGGCPGLWVYFTIDDPSYCTLQIVLVADERVSVSIFRDD
jgi:hypothetical protein